MTHEFSLQEMRTYLIVGNETNVIYDTIDAGYGSTTREKAMLSLAKQAVKDNEEYCGEKCRIVRAVCNPVSDICPWCCGKTFAQAEKNYYEGYFDNWSAF